MMDLSMVLKTLGSASFNFGALTFTLIFNSCALEKTENESMKIRNNNLISRFLEKV